MYQDNGDALEKWKEGGRISAQALHFGKQLIKEGASVLGVSEQIEAKIRALGGELAFPVNISCNEVAAHDSARYKDERVFGEDVVKLDVGAHVDGFLGDNAVTVDLTGKYGEFIKAATAARSAACKIATPGVNLGEIGRTVQEVVESHGLKPIRNLSGHGIGQYNAHIAPTIPNFDTKDMTELQENMVIAIEPFVTDGVGLIQGNSQYEIYNFTDFKPLRLPFVRKVAQWVQVNKALLPFSRRELLEAGFSDMHVNLTLRQMEQSGALDKHDPLVEKSGAIVAQAEWTVMVKDKPIILTTLE